MFGAGWVMQGERARGMTDLATAMASACEGGSDTLPTRPGTGERR